jgi:hypothetical protein
VNTSQRSKERSLLKHQVTAIVELLPTAMVSCLSRIRHSHQCETPTADVGCHNSRRLHRPLARRNRCQRQKCLSPTAAPKSHFRCQIDNIWFPTQIAVRNPGRTVLVQLRVWSNLSRVHRPTRVPAHRYCRPWQTDGIFVGRLESHPLDTLARRMGYALVVAGRQPYALGWLSRSWKRPRRPMWLVSTARTLW